MCLVIVLHTFNSMIKVIKIINIFLLRENM